PGGEGDGLLRRYGDGVACHRVLHHARPATPLEERAEARIGELRRLVTRHFRADEVVTHFREDGVHDARDGFLGELARHLLAPVDTLDELRLRHFLGSPCGPRTGAPDYGLTLEVSTVGGSVLRRIPLLG